MVQKRKATNAPGRYSNSTASGRSYTSFADRVEAKSARHCGYPVWLQIVENEGRRIFSKGTSGPESLPNCSSSPRNRLQVPNEAFFLQGNLRDAWEDSTYVVSKLTKHRVLWLVVSLVANSHLAVSHFPLQILRRMIRTALV